MSLSKSKCWYWNNCLQFLKCAATLNVTKDAILFHQKLSYNFTLHVRLTLFPPAPHFGTILPNAVAMKSIKNNLRKSRLTVRPKMLVKVSPPYCITSKVTSKTYRISCSGISSWKLCNNIIIVVNINIAARPNNTWVAECNKTFFDKFLHFG
jgi:hypothetical protein